jgi:hypothetical protein
MMGEAKLNWARNWLESPKRLYVGGSWRDSVSNERRDVITSDRKDSAAYQNSVPPM